VLLAGAWEVCIVWEQIPAHNRQKVVSEEKGITKRLIQRNGTHLSMSGDSPFAQGAIADSIGYSGEGTSADKILKGA